MCYIVHATLVLHAMGEIQEKHYFNNYSDALRYLNARVNRLYEDVKAGYIHSYVVRISPYHGEIK